jgi:hypothetical protein
MSETLQALKPTSQYLLIFEDPLSFGELHGGVN